MAGETVLMGAFFPLLGISLETAALEDGANAGKGR